MPKKNKTKILTKVKSTKSLPAGKYRATIVSVVNKKGVLTMTLKAIED